MIQIYGAGMAGSYLYHLLAKNGFNVRIYDKRNRPDCRCAWGIVYREAREYYSEIEINLEDYLLVKPEYVVINGFAFQNAGVVIFDKKKLLSDLWVEFGLWRNPRLIVDATGVARAFLPKINADRFLLTFQTIEEHNIEKNIYIWMERTGYAWAFPLGNRKWHIGAEHVEKKGLPNLIEKLRKKYGFKKSHAQCQCSAKIRLLQPSRCLPFVRGNVVGIGEAIGCVSGSGEGNAPSLASAKILYDCINKGDFLNYERRILKELDWVEREQKFVDGIFKGKTLTVLGLLPKIIAVENKRTFRHSIEVVKSLIDF